MNVQQGVPTLLQQVLAARIPSKQQEAMSRKREERLDQTLQGVKMLGTATTKDLSEVTGFSESVLREYLVVLAKRELVISWTPPNPRHAKRWSLAGSTKRRKK